MIQHFFGARNLSRWLFSCISTFLDNAKSQYPNQPEILASLKCVDARVRGLGKLKKSVHNLYTLRGSSAESLQLCMSLI